MQFWIVSVYISYYRADQAEVYEHVDGCDNGFYGN